MAIQLFSSRQRVATVPSLVHYVVSTLFSAMISVQPQCNSELFHRCIPSNYAFATLSCNNPVESLLLLEHRPSNSWTNDYQGGKRNERAMLIGIYRMKKLLSQIIIFLPIKFNIKFISIFLSYRVLLYFWNINETVFIVFYFLIIIYFFLFNSEIFIYRYMNLLWNLRNGLFVVSFCFFLINSLFC